MKELAKLLDEQATELPNKVEQAVSECISRDQRFYAANSAI
jgi:hypothetical protein